MTTGLKLMLAAILAAYAVLALLSRSHARETAQATGFVEVLPVTFAHADHVEQNCLVCHHNARDETGDGLCIDCHLRDAKVAPLLEKQFHGLCMGCHEEKRQAGEKSGPLRRCIDCHHVDQLP